MIALMMKDLRRDLFMILAFVGVSLIVMATFLQEANMQEETAGSLLGLFTLCYVGVFKWGYGKIKIAVFIIYIALMLLPQLSVILIREVGGANGPQKIAAVLADMNLTLIFVCAAVVFSGLMLLGIKVMKDERE